MSAVSTHGSGTVTRIPRRFFLYSLIEDRKGCHGVNAIDILHKLSA